MRRHFSGQLAGQIGESLVVSELGRRGIVATAFAGNVPDIDLLAYKNGKTLHLQVKAWRAGSVSTDATRFLSIDIDGDKQHVRGLAEDLDEDLIYVFVHIGAKAGQDSFFIVRQGDLARSLHDSYTRYLDQHGGGRPRNPTTTHSSIEMEHLADHEGNWSLIEESLGFGETAFPRFAQKPRKCPNCGGVHIASILYGYPDLSERLFAQEQRGEVVFGGCLIGEDGSHPIRHIPLNIFNKNSN